MSRTGRLERTQTLGITLDQAWEFFSDPANLARITPEWLHFTVCCEVERPMYAGQILEYTVRPLPYVRVRWLTEITHVHAPHFFVDEQRLGPYKFWHHQHRFKVTDAGVQMQDIVHYRLAGWVVGDLLERTIVRPRLEAIFDHRAAALRSGIIRNVNT